MNVYEDNQMRISAIRKRRHLIDGNSDWSTKKVSGTKMDLRLDGPIMTVCKDESIIVQWNYAEFIASAPQDIEYLLERVATLEGWYGFDTQLLSEDQVKINDLLTELGEARQGVLPLQRENAKLRRLLAHIASKGDGHYPTCATPCHYPHNELDELEVEKFAVVVRYGSAVHVFSCDSYEDATDLAAVQNSRPGFEATIHGLDEEGADDPFGISDDLVPCDSCVKTFPEHSLIVDHAQRDVPTVCVSCYQEAHRD